MIDTVNPGKYEWKSFWAHDVSNYKGTYFKDQEKIWRDVEIRCWKSDRHEKETKVNEVVTIETKAWAKIFEAG